MPLKISQSEKNYHPIKLKAQNVRQLITFSSKIVYELIFTIKIKTKHSAQFFLTNPSSNEGISSIHIQNQPAIKDKTIKKWAYKFLKPSEIRFHLMF